MKNEIDSTAGSRHCAEDACRHSDALKHVKRSIKSATHQLSQPLMVIQGYLELLELDKCGQDPDSMKQILNNIFEQLEMVKTINGRLRELTCNATSGPK